MSKMAPQIRFQGFTDDWEERKLSDIGDIVTGNTPKTSNSLYYNGSFLFVSPADIQETRYIYKTNTTLTAAGFNTGRLVKTGSTLFVSIGSTIGKVAQASTDVITNQQINSIVPFKHYDNNFIYTSLVNIAKKIKTLAVTQAVPIINKTEFSKNIIYVPDLQEQQKIGLFFKQLDDTIALHQRMLDLLKEQKKGFLQKMFPKNGAKVPELRFAGFGDDWEERKLGDEVQIVMGQSPNSENYTDNPNNYILVQGNADMKNGHVFPRVWTTQVTKQADKNDLILSVRAPVGDIGKTAYDVVIGRGVAAIKGNEFIFQSLGKMKSDGYWTRYSTGSTFESINSTDIKEAIINVPAVEEQSKIGSFFKAIDNTIALHQRKLDLLKEQKKGFLQKMFVS
ncbi:restriction endonuclease subunit S [Leuconostoc citreum]